MIEENEGTDDGLSEEEPIQEEQIASQPLVEESIEEPAITEESAIAQESTEQTSPKEPEEAITETDIEEKVEQLEDEEVPEEEEEPVTIGSLAMPSYSAAQLASRVKKAGDAPDIVKDDITKVTLFDYSDIISGDVDDMEE